MTATPVDFTTPSVTQKDRDAAHLAMIRNWPQLEIADPNYAAFAKKLAEYHCIAGTKNFELRYGLRLPCNRVEEWQLQFMQGRLTKSELRSLLKADAERPLDLQMLTEFYDAYQDNLSHYSEVLQKAVELPREVGTSSRSEKELQIHEHIGVLKGKMPLWREHLEKVFDFLEEFRITSGRGLVCLGEFEGTSAHWLAQLVFTRMCEAWRSCNEVADRSQHDPRYLYSTTAIDLFAQTWLRSFPSPQSMRERMREEFVLARSELTRSIGSQAPNAQPPQDTKAIAAQIKATIDNESRAQILLGEITTLVGEAGHIFRPTPNADWGIDGEIEFKDTFGHATGRRVYLQLKSGDSHLQLRQRDGTEVFSVKNRRHLEYWKQHAYPVLLVIRQSSGLIRWMDVSAHLREADVVNRQIAFRGSEVNVEEIQRLAAAQ